VRGIFMEKRFSNILVDENISDSSLGLKAYSFCASESEAMPDMVIWPETTEQAARVIRECNQTRTSLTIRGAGTSTADGCIGTRTVILSSEKMNRVLRLDAKNKTVEVQAGMRISELNEKLSELKLVFPLTPFNPAATFGGLFAIDAPSRESERLGRFSELVDEFEFVDGTGKVYHTYKRELVAGREGINGFITKMTLNLMEQPVISLDVFSFSELSELLGKTRQLKKDSELFFLEYLDTKTSAALGFAAAKTLIAGYSGLKGRYKTVLDVRAHLQKLDSVNSLLRKDGYHFILDPKVSLEKSYDLLAWCEKNDVALHGHAGLGLFYAYFGRGPKETEKMDSFRGFIKSIGGSLGHAFGIGSANADFISAEEKKALIKVKDEYDYNNVLNPGKMVSYR
jgi:FAD/FMN-containing dehydrogenase